MKVSGQLHATASLHLGKGLQLHTALVGGWDPQPVWMIWRKVSELSEINSLVVQPVPVSVPTAIFRTS